MAQQRGLALSKTIAFLYAPVYLSDSLCNHVQHCKVDSVLTWSNIKKKKCIFKLQIRIAKMNAYILRQRSS